ncbi:hypothetical protein PNOK_0763600 [Pyrrhoderma noxium]|uniref:N-acetyltransferase domain-containing protein n=1 Tax=Pyrrhoderma noxium TaxID=2282107 RepID=A0A286UD86_9AGAM|nr:hypothetical protein PNOK_0763600 [Pyrrhoderma noxium]
MDVNIRRLKQNATEEDIAACVCCANDAFGFSDLPPEAKNFFCGEMSLMPYYHRWIIESGLAGGKVYVAETQQLGIIGSAVWFGPGEEWLGVFSHKEQMEAFDKFAKKAEGKIPGLPSWWFNCFFPKYKKLTDDSLGDSTVKLDSWHCLIIGVLKAYQRAKIGSRLISIIMEEASRCEDARNKRLTLEAGPVEFYKTLGFVVKVLKGKAHWDITLG